MKASVVNLRYKTKNILNTLGRNVKIKGEEVLISGRNKGEQMVEDHPFFGMMKNEESSVILKMKKLRGGR